VDRWIDATDENLLSLSVLTVGEIRKGIPSLPGPSSRRVSLETWLDHDVALRFADRILAIDQAVADRWGVITAFLPLPPCNTTSLWSLATPGTWRLREFKYSTPGHDERSPVAHPHRTASTTAAGSFESM
jgi:hypothetical protein